MTEFSVCVAFSGLVTASDFGKSSGDSPETGDSTALGTGTSSTISGKVGGNVGAGVVAVGEEPRKRFKKSPICHLCSSSLDCSIKFFFWREGVGVGLTVLVASV